MAAYVLPGKVLVIVVNTSGKARKIDLACDFQTWAPQVPAVTMGCNLMAPASAVPWEELDFTGRHLTTWPLEKGGIGLFEVFAKGGPSAVL